MADKLKAAVRNGKLLELEVGLEEDNVVVFYNIFFSSNVYKIYKDIKKNFKIWIIL